MSQYKVKAVADEWMKVSGLRVIERVPAECFSESEWTVFCQENILPHGTLGFFEPRSGKSFLLKDSKFYLLHYIHEQYGHGIFFSESILGREIVSVEKELEHCGITRTLALDESFSPGEDKKYSSSVYLLMNRLQCLTSCVHFLCEGFALWTEFHIGTLAGLEELLRERTSHLTVQQQNSLSYVSSFGDTRSVFKACGVEMYA